MTESTERTGKGFEIVTYHPKFTANAGNALQVYQTDDVKEVAEFLAKRAWSAAWGDPKIANPCVYFNGERWPKTGN